MINIKYNTRTDLAIEEIEYSKSKIKTDVEERDNVVITTVEVGKNDEKIINKKKGIYITIEYEDIVDHKNEILVSEVVNEKLKLLLNKYNIVDESSCLLIGLGNRQSTPDSLGPLVLDEVIITKHLFELGDIESGFRNTCGITPGVTGETGIETSDVLSAIIEKVRPNFIVAIDALAAGAISRVNKTIQMTDSGIHPGSGVGNARKEISIDTTGIPVFAIGIPTVVDAVTIVGDTINYILNHISHKVSSPASKLSIGVNLKKEVEEISEEQKEKLLGMIGMLSEEEQKQFITEVLSPIGYNLMVTPKEIDFLINKMALVLSNGINSALHQQISITY